MELEDFVTTKPELEPSIRRSPEPDRRISTTAAFVPEPELDPDPTLPVRETADSAVRGRRFVLESSERLLAYKNNNDDNRYLTKDLRLDNMQH